MRRLRLMAILWVLTSAVVCAPTAARDAAARVSRSAIAEPSRDLARARDEGLLSRQREHLWSVFLALTQSTDATGPAFTRWTNRHDVLAAYDVPVSERLPFPGLPASARVDPLPGGAVRLDAPVITFIHFNPAADRHVREQHLYETTALEALRQQGPASATVRGARSIPVWPRDAATLMTGWWPVARTGLTPLPVWDTVTGQTRVTGSNSYVSWPRVVVIDPRRSARHPAPVRRVEFAGRVFRAVPRIGLSQFFHLPVDAALAAQLMEDPASRKAALIALGRPLTEGDRLVLVAAHVMTAELPGGIFGTFWWHDRPRGAFAADRPAGLEGAWRAFLMDVAFDAERPRDPDGGPKTCFNPWFDAAFPSGGSGNGIHSNCVNCHHRASYPPEPFLPVRRGAPDFEADRAYAPDRLQTGGVWSLVRPVDAGSRQQ